MLRRSLAAANAMSAGNSRSLTTSSIGHQRVTGRL
jgi:hypothetical protein